MSFQCVGHVNVKFGDHVSVNVKLGYSDCAGEAEVAVLGVGQVRLVKCRLQLEAGLVCVIVIFIVSRCISNAHGHDE